MAKMMMPRLISKEQAKIVAESGGIIGVWKHLAETTLEYAQNIRAMVDVVGIDHVCIGNDSKLTPAYRSPGSFDSKPANPKSPGSGSPDNQEQVRPKRRKSLMIIKIVEPESVQMKRGKTKRKVFITQSLMPC